MNMYHYKTTSNAAPFVSDTATGFIDGETPMEALRKVVNNYTHPCGLFAAGISECSVAMTLLARYLSPKAAIQHHAGSGTYRWKNGKLFVNDVEQPMLKEEWHNEEECKK